MALARKLKKSGIPTVPLVQSFCWAWRSKTHFKHQKNRYALNVGTISVWRLPIYHEHIFPLFCVGHTLADDIH